MKSRLLFYRQETPYSCVPACLRVVLSGFGLDISEAELRVLCDCTPFGTEALKAVDAVRNLGFPTFFREGSPVHNGTPFGGRGIAVFIVKV